jgi:hypothetical protein
MGSINMLTVADLVFCNLALLFDIETADVKMPLALESCWCRNTNLRCGWWGQPLDTSHANVVFPYLFHLEIADVCSHIAIVIERALDFIQQLRGA